MSERGNSMLEMLLFAPVALFFLVAVIDVGMSFRDRSGIIDATRSAIIAHPAALPILETFDPESGFNTGEQRQFLVKMSEQISDGIHRSRGDHAIRAEQQPFIRVSLVKLSIDPHTGTVAASSIVQPEVILNPNNVTKCGDADLADVVAAKLSAESGTSYALPLANVFNGSSERYMPYSYLVAAQVCSRAIGIGGESTAAIAGRFFDFHDEQMLPLRIQPNTLW